ncbi:MAG: Transcriptional regulator, HxlR family [Devosia sp.]|uniref:winged helix-turn-helix transcriptional regulator n=1 Tax=Devosia sp. TaxID=1871048 RepID=UPI00262658B2|nr:helix-turn-helix domain-containing protein [Devosia sp.]MDB5542325.1 Transcriptional regulator, HxlR family [Devosia sp.]
MSGITDGRTFPALRLKWTVEVIAALDGRIVRFGVIQRLVPGITPKMLSAVLHQLARDGLVHRRQYPSIPPRVDYELTGLGTRLAQLLSLLTDLAVSSSDEIEASRQRYDRRDRSMPSAIQRGN